jgi:hypothetical protein
MQYTVQRKSCWIWDTEEKELNGREEMSKEGNKLEKMEKRG